MEIFLINAPPPLIQLKGLINPHGVARVSCLNYKN